MVRTWCPLEPPREPSDCSKKSAFFKSCGLWRRSSLFKLPTRHFFADPIFGRVPPGAPPRTLGLLEKVRIFSKVADFRGVHHFSRPQPIAFGRRLSSAACPLEPPREPSDCSKKSAFFKSCGLWRLRPQFKEQLDRSFTDPIFGRRPPWNRPGTLGGSKGPPCGALWGALEPQTAV